MHLAIQLLNKGYKVRGTLRDLSRAESIKKIIAKHCSNSFELDVCKGELTNPHHWDKAVEDIDYIMHVASPLPFDPKNNKDDLIIPAREGTINILYAATKHRIKR